MHWEDFLFFFRTCLTLIFGDDPYDFFSLIYSSVSFFYSSINFYLSSALEILVEPLIISLMRSLLLVLLEPKDNVL